MRPVLEGVVRDWRQFHNSYNDVSDWLEEAGTAMQEGEVPFLLI